MEKAFWNWLSSIFFGLTSTALKKNVFLFLISKSKGKLFSLNSSSGFPDYIR